MATANAVAKAAEELAKALVTDTASNSVKATREIAAHLQQLTLTASGIGDAVTRVASDGTTAEIGARLLEGQAAAAARADVMLDLLGALKASVDAASRAQTLQWALGTLMGDAAAPGFLVFDADGRGTNSRAVLLDMLRAFLRGEAVDVTGFTLHRGKTSATLASPSKANAKEEEARRRIIHEIAGLTGTRPRAEQDRDTGRWYLSF